MTVQNLIWTVIRFRFEELIFVDIVLGWSDAHAPPFRVWPLRNPKVATVFRLSSQDMKGTFLDMSTIIAPASCLWRSFRYSTPTNTPWLIFSQHCLLAKYDEFTRQEHKKNILRPKHAWNWPYTIPARSRTTITISRSETKNREELSATWSKF
jgi:hypothetical protein